MWAVREVGHHNSVCKATLFSSSQFYRWEVQVVSTGLYNRVSQAQYQGVGAGPYPEALGKTLLAGPFWFWRVWSLPWQD